SLPVCNLGSICLPGFAGSDPDNNLKSVTVTGGVLSNGTVCFTPIVGLNTIILTAEDSCGAKATCTTKVTVTLNSPPVAGNVPASVDTFMCAAAQVCRQFSATDINGNGLTWSLLTGVGSVSSTGVWCFTPAASGSYCVSAVVADPCGASDTVSICYNVTLNTPPTVDVGWDAAVFQCGPHPICRKYVVSDANNNVVLEQLISGGGTIDTATNEICFTPSGSGTYTFIVQVADACGAVDEDTVVFTVTINAPPQVSLGRDTSVFQCTAGSVCRTYQVSDPNGLSDIASETILASPGGASLDTAANRICYTPNSSGTYTFVIQVKDRCGAIALDTMVMTIAINRPPTVALSADTVKTVVCLGVDSAVCVSYTTGDLDGGKLTESLVSGTATIDTAQNTICVAPNANGTYVVVVQVSDSCGAVVRDTAVIVVNRQLCCPSIAIEKVHKAFQGAQTCVSITMQGFAMTMGGYDLLIAYDASALSPMSVNAGQFITDCGWEYFTYRYGANGNCGSGCPSGLIRIIAAAETNNGAYHPYCFKPATADTTQLASICFLVTNDRTFECQYVPVRFFWMDCADNIISNKLGDTTFVSDTVYDYANPIPINNGTVGYPTYYGAQNWCISSPQPGKPPQQRCLDFYNGGVDIVCADSIDARGDINLNGQAYEIADAVMFSNYFIKGLSAFVPHIEGSTAASDINADGISLSVADLVYLIRVVVGDAREYPKPIYPSVEVSTDRGAINVTGAELGAVFMVLKGNVAPLLATDAKMEYGFDGTNTRVLVHVPFGGEAQGQIIKGFSGDIIYTDAELVSIEMADKFGYAVGQSIPTDFALLQNYPNPFNPTTSVSFDLPAVSDVKLEVFDLLGRHVATLASESMPAGRHVVEWNGKDSKGQTVASGVYLYRLDAGSYHSTRKMVLLK
ncbi:MAG: T9SS type A sorting domain-containing protein, partial [candidate division Zixibacteria bacterium]|nr:T9SS type A sorting domain-containing protein [candidate division Zixibacteria bacterium]